MQPLRAHSWAEAYLYLKVTPCRACAQGPWELQVAERPAAVEPPPPTGGGQVRSMRAKCLHCGAEQEFTFHCPAPGPQRPLPPALERINPGDEPSEIIDLGQWLSLFHLLVDQAHRCPDAAESRRVAFQAAQCLDEALKFYTDDDELPPASAFRTEPSRHAFAEHPEKFARQRLRDMRSRLPDLRVMERRLARDAGGGPRRPWWRFWRR